MFLNDNLRKPHPLKKAPEDRLLQTQDASGQFPKMSEKPIYPFHVKNFFYSCKKVWLFLDISHSTLSWKFAWKEVKWIPFLWERVHLNNYALTSHLMPQLLHCRFSRHGQPHLLRSNKGTNWQIFTIIDIQDLFFNHTKDWKTNHPRALLFGGVWKRLIRLCKDFYMPFRSLVTVFVILWAFNVECKLNFYNGFNLMPVLVLSYIEIAKPDSRKLKDCIFQLIGNNSTR